MFHIVCVEIQKMVCLCQVKNGHLQTGAVSLRYRTGCAKLNLEGRLISFNGELSHHSLLVNKIFWVSKNFSLSGIPTYFLTRALRAGFGHTYTQHRESEVLSKESIIIIECRGLQYSNADVCMQMKTSVHQGLNQTRVIKFYDEKHMMIINLCSMIIKTHKNH